MKIIMILTGFLQNRFTVLKKHILYKKRLLLMLTIKIIKLFKIKN